MQAAAAAEKNRLKGRGGGYLTIQHRTTKP
jgi:hypothetical protein